MLARISGLVALAWTAAALPIVLEHAIGTDDASFNRRCSVTAEVAAPKPVFTVSDSELGAGKLTTEQLTKLARAVEADDLYRIRASANEGQSFVQASVKACALVAAGLSHNIRFLLDSDGSLRAADIVLQQSKGFSGCRGRQGIPPAAWTAFQRQLAKGQDAAVQLTSRFTAMGVDEATTIPTLTAAKGAPYPGQKEFSDADVAAALGLAGQAQAAGTQGSDPAAVEAALAAKQAEEPPKSFLQRNWHLLAIGVIWVFMNASKEDPAPAADAEGRQGAGQRQGQGATRPAAGQQAAPGGDRAAAARARLQAQVQAQKGSS